LIDSHAHLDDEEFGESLPEVVNRARRSGVRAVISSGLDPESCLKNLELSKKYRGFVFPSFGLDASDPIYTDEKAFSDLSKLIEEHANEIVAVGEVGLDYKQAKRQADKEAQKLVFSKFVELADKHGKPLVIHCRVASSDMTRLIVEGGIAGAVLHAFPGTVEQALRLVKAGNFISVPTSVVYSRQKQELAERVPLSNLLVETDSPVMSPFPNVKRNEPSFLTVAVEKVAEIKGVSTETVAEQTMRNAVKVYSLRLSHLPPVGFPTS
jgi:TatD DNase family protein